MYSLEYIEENKLPKPIRKDSPELGEQFNYLKIVAYGKPKGLAGYFCECICGKYIHVKFAKLRSGHTKSCGCNKRERIDAADFQKFLNECEANNTHGYDLSTVTFDDWKNGTVYPICPVYGKTAVSKGGLRRGRTCFKCGTDRASAQRLKTTEQFIIDAKAVHGDRFTYDNCEYTGSHDKVTITCQKHGDFKQSATDHLSGYGCKHCVSSSPFEKSKPTWIYVSLWADDTGLQCVKVGVTNSHPSSRLRTQSSQNRLDGLLIYGKEYPSGDKPMMIEKTLSELFASKYMDKEIFGDGWTETYPPSQLDNIINELHKEH